MSTIIDLKVLQSAGAAEALCTNLQKLGCEVKASQDEAIITGKDGIRLYRVTKDGVDQQLLRSIFDKSTSLQKWVGECRTAARKSHGNNKVAQEYESDDPALIGFKGEDGKVHVQVVKKHENTKKKYEKHAEYEPLSSVNTSLYRLGRIAMEQLKGPKLEASDMGLKEILLAPAVRYDEKKKAHIPTQRLSEQKLETKHWSDTIVYSDAKVEKHGSKHHHCHNHG